MALEGGRGLVKVLDSHLSEIGQLSAEPEYLVCIAGNDKELCVWQGEGRWVWNTPRSMLTQRFPILQNLMGPHRDKQSKFPQETTSWISVKLALG